MSVSLLEDSVRTLVELLKDSFKATFQESVLLVIVPFEESIMKVKFFGKKGVLLCRPLKITVYDEIPSKVKSTLVDVLAFPYQNDN